MHVIVLKYVQVLCITIFFSNNVNCDNLLVHNEREDQELYRIGACTAYCMGETFPGGRDDQEPDVPVPKTIQSCYKLCTEDGRLFGARPLVKRRDPSLRINLICRDSSSLIIEIRPDGIGRPPYAGKDDEDVEPVMKLSPPGGNQNQLNALHGATGGTDRPGDDRTVPAVARRKRAIGTGEPLQTERQKGYTSSGANLVQDGGASVDSDAVRARTRPGPVPIYLVKVQESEQELGDRIVYMCPFIRTLQIPAKRGHDTVAIDISRQLGLRVLDHDAGIYSFDNDTYLCQIDNVDLGEFGVYDLNVSRDGNCALVTAKQPVDIYLPFLTIALIVLALIGIVRLARYGLHHSRMRSYLASPAPPPAGAGDLSAEESDKPETEPACAAPVKNRLQSLDTFRGIAIMLMIFVNSGGGHYWWIEHATWNGLHVADLVFPWFLFIMGVCVPISLRGQISRNVPRRSILSNIAVRSVKLFVIGLCLNSINGPTLGNLRIFGVLQRFGVAYFVVSTVHLFCYERGVLPQNRILRANDDIFRLKKQWLVIGLLTLVYVLVIFFIAEPGCPRGYFGPGGSHLANAFPHCTGGITGYIDRMMLGVAHIYQRPTIRFVYDSMPFDPEGPFGCIPTILQVFIGLQCGCTILTFTEPRQRLTRFGLWSVVLGLIAGLLCGFSKNDGFIPVNKNLWSLSYVLATCSLAYVLLSVCYYAIDVKRVWSGRPFVYAGMNAIVLYVGHTVFHKMLPWHWSIGTMNTHFMRTLEALWNTVLWNLIALYLFKRNTFYNL